MTAGETVIYRDPSGQPRSVKMLLFQRAVHVYDSGSDQFIAAFPYQTVRLQREDNSYAHFDLLPNHSLEVPLRHSHYHELIRLAKGKRSGAWQKLKWPVVLIGTLALLTGIYLQLVSTVSGFALQFISPQKEAELGDMMYQQLIETEKVDARGTALLKRFAADLHLSDQYKLQYTVVDDTLVNAFAIPGGHIVVYKGILQKMASPEELVALLGHESSHINERHSLRSILRQMTGGMMLSMVFGDLGTIGGAIVNNTEGLRSLSYSRQLEKDADQKGMDRMVSNEVDPVGMVKLMDRLQASESGQQLPGFLSSHPLTADRKADAQAYARSHPVATALSATLVRDWNALKSEMGE